MSRWHRSRRHKRIQIIIARDGSQCCFCGGDLDLSISSTDDMGVTFEHVVPKAYGGGNEISNLKLAHSICNNTDANRPFISQPLGDRSSFIEELYYQKPGNDLCYICQGKLDPSISGGDKRVRVIHEFKEYRLAHRGCLREVDFKRKGH